MPPKLPQTDTLEHIEQLSPTIYVRKPSSEAYDSSAPSSILLLAWLNGTLRQLRRYVTTYASMYPTARIIVVLDRNEHLARSEAAQQAALEPIVRMVRSEPDTRLLVHAFSNSGVCQLCQLAKAYQRTGASSATLPVRAIIFDSAPGRATLKKAVMAMSTGLPQNRVLHALGTLAIYGAMSVVAAGHALGISAAYMPKMWDEVVDAELFDRETARVYLFDRADLQIAWQDIADHVQMAQEKGFNVRGMEEFHGGGHVRHAIVEPERYWDIVRTTWESCRQLDAQLGRVPSQAVSSKL